MSDTRGARVDIAHIAMQDSQGRQLLQNGDFNREMAHWFFSSDRHHLPWHIKNAALHVLFEQGLVGLALLGSAYLLVLVRLSFGRGRDHPLAPAIVAALIGFGAVGAFDSLLDVPRIGFLFFMLLLLGLGLRALPASAGLNPAQLEAVYHLSGPCLVIAGAGSGKTRVITTKIAQLLVSGYRASQIAAITFTNKAAQEMRERAKALVGNKSAKDLAISTFHSLGVRLLREEGSRVGLKEQFSILDSDDVLNVLKDAGGTTDANQARRWQWTISLWKNQGLGPAEAAKV
eukprot:gene48202-59036_t